MTDDEIFERLTRELQGAYDDGIPIDMTIYGVRVDTERGIYKLAGCGVCAIGATMLGRAANPSPLPGSIIKQDLITLLGRGEAFTDGLIDGTNPLEEDNEDYRDENTYRAGRALGLRVLNWGREKGLVTND